MQGEGASERATFPSRGRRPLRRIRTVQYRRGGDQPPAPFRRGTALAERSGDRSLRGAPQRGREKSPGAQKRLDSKKGKGYTECTKAAGPPLPLLVPAAQKAAEKANMARMNAPRETASAEPKGKAKTLRQKDRSRTGLRKVRLQNLTRKHTKGATARQGGNLSGIDGGRKTKGVFLPLFARKNPSVSRRAGDGGCNLPFQGRQERPLIPQNAKLQTQN